MRTSAYRVTRRTISSTRSRSTGTEAAASFRQIRDDDVADLSLHQNPLSSVYSKTMVLKALSTYRPFAIMLLAGVFSASALALDSPDKERPPPTSDAAPLTADLV